MPCPLNELESLGVRRNPILLFENIFVKMMLRRVKILASSMLTGSAVGDFSVRTGSVHLPDAGRHRRKAGERKTLKSQPNSWI